MDGVITPTGRYVDSNFDFCGQQRVAGNGVMLIMMGAMEMMVMMDMVNNIYNLNATNERWTLV